MLIILLVSAIILLLHFWWRIAYRSRLPPSPWGIPLIGHFHLMGEFPQHSLEKLSRKYGPLMLLRFGMVRTLVVSSPSMAREVLSIQDSVFASRPYTFLGEHMAGNFKDIVYAPYGEHWKRMRKLCRTELFNTKSIESFSWLRMEEASIMLSQVVLASKRKEAVNLKDLIANFTLNMTSRIVMSKALFGPSESMESQARNFNEMAEEVGRLACCLHVSDYLPSFLRFLDWNIPRAKKLNQLLSRFAQDIIDERRMNNAGNENKDFLDILLDQFQPSEDRITQVLLLDMLASGNDSASSLEWALAEILVNSRVLKKVQEEIHSVVGPKRMVQESDIPSLGYLNAVIKEAFRLHPPVPLLLPHMSMKDCKIEGYHVPKGSTLLVNVHAIGRDINVWENAAEFLPERFMTSNVDVLGQHFELLPFGSGRRACPGMNLGLRTVQLALSNLIHGFDWSILQDDCDVYSGGSSRMDRFPQAIPVARLDEQAYLYSRKACN